MKKTVGVLSLIVMLLSQVFSPFVYAVTGEEASIEEPVVEETIEIPEVVEEGPIEEAIEPKNPVEWSGIVVEKKENTENAENAESNSGDNIELPEIESEVVSGDFESMSGDIDNLSGTSENLSGEQKNLKEETDNLTGAENSSGFLENIKQGIKNLLGIGDNEKSETNEDFESMEIYGTGEYEGVKVEVYAATGLFASGTVLIIEPIVEEELKQVKEVLISGDVQMIEEDDEQTLVAFDITFRDPETQEELQPKTGTVQLKFNYKDNVSLVQAEENEEQEVKVYHLNDIDEEGNKIEELIGTTVEEVAVNEEERENNKVVIDVNKFSPYIILLSTVNSDVYTVSFNTNGGTPKNDVEITGGTKLIMSSGLQHSYTRNISEDGTYTENYGNSWGDSDVVNKIITIPGVDKLKVTIKHGTESTSYDWICMRAGSYPNYTAENNYSTSMVGKLGGTTNTLTSNTYYVDGDTVTFSFRSDTSSNYYGYYATVEGLIDNYGDDPIREGSKFLGRFTEDGNERNIYDDKVESDITLNAKWECKYGYYTGENNQSCIELPYSQYTIEGDDPVRNTFKYRTLKIAGSNGSEYFIMDKNLGALEAWDGTRNDSSHNASYGYYYQRGNNYGFSSKTTSAGGYSQITVPNDKIPSNYSSSSWIYNTKWNVQDDLRGAGGTEEDRKGPCPEGWHIPEILERKTIYKARDKSENKSTDKGTVAQNFMYDLRIPPAGYRSYSMGFGNIGSRSNLWSTTTYIDQYARNFYVPGNYFSWNNAEYRSAGIPVRCVKNNPEYNVTLHINDKIIQQKLKKNSIITIPFNSTDENYVIEGWYRDEDLTEKFDFSQVVSGDIVLYANQIEFKYGTISIWNPNNPYSGFTIMDRNLGATEAGTGENSYGYMYQWGNNYGFPNTGELALFENQAEWNNSYDNSGYYETGFYADKDYWLDDVNHVGLWGGSGDNSTNNWGLNNINKTVENRKGPCPEGWHIPSAGEWSKLLEYWIMGNIVDGSMYSSNNLNYLYFKNNDEKQKFISDLKLVNPGYRNDEGTILGYGDSTYQFEYRTSTPVGGSYPSSSTKYSYIFYMNGNEFKVDHNYIGARNQGRPLRCFKNVYNPDFHTINFQTNGGYDFDAVLVPSGSNLIIIDEPQKPGYYFEGWFTDESLSIPYDFTQPVNDDFTLYAKRKGDFGTISISDPNNPYSGFTIMDRNLGATEAGTGENSYGYMYQWGNNHGFPYRGTYSNMNTITTTGFAMWNSGYDNNGYYGTQYVVRVNNVGDYREDNQLHDGLWGGNDDYTGNNRGLDIINATAANKKGPCPEGWHIPSAGEWSKLLEYRDMTNVYQTNSESNLEISNFQLNRLSLVSNKLAQYFLFPMRGNYYNSYGNSNNTFNYYVGNPTGYFWSSTPTKSDKYVFSLYLTEKDAYAGYVYDRTNGHTIRCFRNQYNPLPEYTLIYNTNGGNQVESRKIRENHKIIGLATPIRNNSIFEGWYVDEDLTDLYDLNQLISGDLNLYAKRGCVSGYVLSEDLQSCEKISVKFRANGGIFGSGDEYIVKSFTQNIKGDGIRYSHTPNVDDDGNKISSYQKGLNTNDVVSIPGTEKLKIRITYGSYNVSWEGWVSMRTGSHTDYRAKTNYASSIIGRENGVDISNYGKLGGGNHTDSKNTKEYIVEGDTVTFGFFSETYNYGGDNYGYYAVITEADNYKTKYSGDAFDNIPEPVREGYTFKGWYFDNETFEHEFNESEVVTGESMNVYAKWIPHHYTIKFDINGGTGNIQDINATYGEKTILPKVTKKGYYLSGWQSEDGVLYRNYIPEGRGLTTEDGGVVLLTAQRQVNPSAAGGGRTITPTIKEQEHNTAEEKQELQVEQVPSTNNSSIQSTSHTSSNTTVDPLILSAYEWAYEHNITTISSLDEANPDGPVTRGHLAKMVVNYATNVLGREIPEKIPSECRWNDWRSDWESEEIKDYAVKSCALGLMGLDMEKFLPNMEVTRAQFGTIMSRLLWGKRYAGGTPYYRKHLNALKENNIMTQIDNPEKRVELRQWVWLMLMRSAQNK